MPHKIQSSPRIEIPGQAQPVPDSSGSSVPTQNIPYLEESVQEDAKYQVQWSNWMEQKSFYRHVFVLLLSWHPECDDMDVQKEVEDLKDVFQDLYNYEVESFHIDSRGPSLPQAQVNLAVAKFVEQNDQDNALFIIYYAGHGSPGKYPGDLNMSARRRHKDKSPQVTHITWNLVEGNLRTTRSDILLIFDCCHAGDLGRTDLSSRSFEYLGATTSNYTRSPGPHSFTSALIWALKKLAKPTTHLTSNTTPMFTTSKLAKTIFDCPDFPEDQKPSLDMRDHDAVRHIILAPLPHDGVTETRSQQYSDDEDDKEDEEDKPTPQYLNLTFHFKRKQDETELRRLADHLKTFMKTENTTLQKVRWGAIWMGTASIPPRHRLRQVVRKIMSQSPTSASRNPLPESRRPKGDRLASAWTYPGPTNDDQTLLLSGASSAIFKQTHLLSSATSVVAEQTFHRPSFWSRILSIFRSARKPVKVELPRRSSTTKSSWKAVMRSMFSRIFKSRSRECRLYDDSEGRSGLD